MKDLKNKNLLIITNGYPSKDGVYNCTFVKSQVDELSKYFNKVIVIASKAYFPKILKNIKFIPKQYREKLKFNNYKYKNIEVYYPTYFLLPFKYFSKRVGDLAYNATLNLIKKKNLKFGLIHAHFTWKSGYVASKLKYSCNIPYVLTIQANRKWFMDLYDSNNKKIYGVWKNADYLIRVNKQDVPLLKKFNKNTINIENTFSNSFKRYSFDKIKAKINIPKSKKILLNVGNYLIEHKNQINLIKAIKELTKIRNDFVLYLIGKGKDEQLIRNKINELDLNKFVKVLGPKPHSEIPYWMNAADLFVLPSYMEGNPTVLFEALACGTPFIGAKTGGSEEIITSSDYGFLLEDPNDYKTLSSLINKGLNKKWNSNKIIRYGNNFCSKNIVERIIKIYDKI